jgi:hypothetical protein
MSYAQDIPVLPLPVHVEQEQGSTLPFSSALTFTYLGLDNTAKAGLQAHWNKFAKAHPAAGTASRQQVQLGLIGKNKQFDELIARPAAQWRDKIGKEGYLLVFNEKQRIIAANTETGLFYGLQTLKQLIRANWKQALLIADYPSFEHRAVYDDISRGPISTVAYIKEQIERLAELKINELSFYIEHVVQPVSHPDFAPANGKLTIPQIKELSAYAASYHMQLVGSFQSFGHFDKILALPQYRSMGETSTLISPLNPVSRKFLKSVIGELCDAFSGPYFNVNCDETFDLGKGKSKAYVDSIGPARYYADHIKFLYDVVKQHHKKLMMWGDIALTHEEILDLLPKDIVYLTWEYGSQPSFAKWITPFQKRGLEFMVCPGILNSYRLIPDMAMATANIDGFLPEGKASGASGVITTVWDDGGAYLFSGDWYGVYKAADKSWNVTAAGKPSFDARYNATAYGADDESYTRALDAMMTLRKLPLTYNLTDNIWNQKLLPDSGRQLILNNTDVDTALHIIYRAKKLIDAAKPQWHGSDINTLKLSIEQYRLIMEGRRQMSLIAADYRKALDIAVSHPSTSVSLLTGAAKVVSDLKNRYLALQSVFRHAWLRENQLYSLDIATRPYDKRIKDLQQLQNKLQQAAQSIHHHASLPGDAAMRLDIVENAHYYFQNWLLCGPFAVDATNKLPAFLYSGDAATEQAPKPGDLISFHQKNFRWQKYASPNGGITELDDFYPAGKGQGAYAFCTITTDKALTTAAFMAANSGMEAFCNGIKVSGAPAGEQSVKKEEKLLLSLKVGTNHLLLKIPAGTAAWSFSFRLDPQLDVTNQKYKYFLNTEKGNHEAE